MDGQLEQNNILAHACIQLFIQMFLNTEEEIDKSIKGPICRIWEDPLAKIAYKVHNYVFISVQSVEKRIIVFILHYESALYIYRGCRYKVCL